MLLQNYIPSPPLKELIEYYWIAETTFIIEDPILHFPLPKGTPMLFFNFSPNMSFKSGNLGCLPAKEKKEVPRNFALGVLTSKHLNEIKGSVGVLGVFFKPTGLFQITGIPSSSFTDQHLDLEDVYGKEIALLSERLMETKGNLERIKIVEQFLISLFKKRINKMQQVAFAAEQIQKCRGNISLQQLASNLKISERHLYRKFIEQIGVGPKYFARIERFNYCISKGIKAKNWHDVVESCGFYDQAHFIKEVNHFCGQRPSAYFPNISQLDSFFHGE